MIENDVLKIEKSLARITLTSVLDKQRLNRYLMTI
jgi:hypothetical protein